MTKDQDLDVAVPILGRSRPRARPAGAAVGRRQRRAWIGPPWERGSDPTNPLIALAIGGFRALQATDAGITASVPLPWGRTALEGMGATRPDPRASDSGLSFGSRAGRAGPRAGATAHLCRRPARTTPQVIRVVGFSGPERCLKALRSFAAGPSTAKLHQAARNDIQAPERRRSCRLGHSTPARCAPITT